MTGCQWFLVYKQVFFPQILIVYAIFLTAINRKLTEHAVCRHKKSNNCSRKNSNKEYCIIIELISVKHFHIYKNVFLIVFCFKENSSIRSFEVKYRMQARR